MNDVILKPTPGAVIAESQMKIFLANAVPVGLLAAITLANNAAGAVFGAVLAIILTVKYTQYVIPILMFAAAYRLMGTLASVHFGWVIIIGFLIGTILKMQLDGHRRWLTSSFVLILLLLVHSFTAEKLLIARSLMLVSLVGGLGMLILSYREKARIVGAKIIIETLFLSIASASIVISLTSYIMFASGQISQERASEMSFSMGEMSSSPSNLTRLLGVAVIISIYKLSTIKSVNFKDTIIFMPAAIFGMATIIYGGSRMPVFSIIAAVLLMIFSPGVKGNVVKKGRLVKAAFIGVILYVLVMAASSLSQEPELLEYGDDVSFRIERAPEISTNVRLELWSDYIDNLNGTSLLFGTGIGHIGNPHNVYFGFFSSFGLIGVGIWLYLFIGAVSVFFRYRSTLGMCLILYSLMAFSSNGDVDKLHFWIVFFLINLYAELLKVNAAQQNSKL